MRKHYSCLLLIIFLFTTFKAAAATITDNGTNKSYSLSSGDVLSIAKGIYKGNINSFPTGATIVVQSGASFQPAFINNIGGSVLTIYGSAVLNSLDLNTAGFALHNYGNFSVGSINLNNTATITNYQGAQLTINNAQNLQGNTTFTNSGELHILGGVNINSGTFINSAGAKTYISGGLSTIGTVINSGYMMVNGGLTINGGASTTNNCSVYINGGFMNNSLFTNNGNIMAQGGVTNNGKMNSSANAWLQGTDFVNSGTVIGSGNFYFSGTTTNNGPFGEDKGGINFYDKTPAGNLWVMDRENTKVYATKNTILPVDSTSIKNRCSSAVNALPVKLMAFNVQSKNGDQAVISWSVAEEINVKEYIVEYSTDGKNFIAKGIVLPDNAAPTSYQLPVAITSLPVHYFRLKMVDNDLSVQYSKVQLLTQQRTLEKLFAIKINPAQTETIIALAESNNPVVTVELLNPVGQPLLQQRVNNAGSSSQVVISNLHRFAKGLYYVRVSDGATTQTQKLIIQ